MFEVNVTSEAQQTNIHSWIETFNKTCIGNTSVYFKINEQCNHWFFLILKCAKGSNGNLSEGIMCF